MSGILETYMYMYNYTLNAETKRCQDVVIYRGGGMGCKMRFGSGWRERK